MQVLAGFNLTRSPGGQIRPQRMVNRCHAGVPRSTRPLLANASLGMALSCRDRTLAAPPSYHKAACHTSTRSRARSSWHLQHNMREIYDSVSSFQAPCGLKTPCGLPMQFILLDGQDTSSAATTQKIVRVHAARHAHTRVRQQRMIRYQRARQLEGDRSKAIDLETACSGQSLEPQLKPVPVRYGEQATTDWEIRPVLHRSPVAAVSAPHRDPFNSFVRVITPFEYFLLDHCMYFGSSLTGEEGHFHSRLAISNRTFRYPGSSPGDNRPIHRAIQRRS
jgi:hypothetical protein